MFTAIVASAVCFNLGAWAMFGSWYEEDKIRVVAWKKGDAK